MSTQIERDTIKARADMERLARILYFEIGPQLHAVIMEISQGGILFVKDGGGSPPTTTGATPDQAAEDMRYTLDVIRQNIFSSNLAKGMNYGGNS